MTKPICRTSVICLFALLFSATSPDQSVHSQVQVYTARQIVNIANDVYGKRDYVAASMFWFAYIQMNPPELANNPAFNAEVQAAWKHSSDTVRQMWDVGQRAANRSPDGSVTAGLGGRPPQVHIPNDAK